MPKRANSTSLVIAGFVASAAELPKEKKGNVSWDRSDARKIATWKKRRPSADAGVASFSSFWLGYPAVPCSKFIPSALKSQNIWQLAKRQPEKHPAEPKGSSWHKRARMGRGRTAPWSLEARGSPRQPEKNTLGSCFSNISAN